MLTTFHGETATLDKTYIPCELELLTNFDLIVYRSYVIRTISFVSRPLRTLRRIPRSPYVKAHSYNVNFVSIVFL